MSNVFTLPNGDLPSLGFVMQIKWKPQEPSALNGPKPTPRAVHIAVEDSEPKALDAGPPKSETAQIKGELLTTSPPACWGVRI